MSCSIERYWHDALYENVRMYLDDWKGEEHRQIEPLKFKPYRGQARFELKDRVVQRLGDPRCSFRTFRDVHPSSGEAPGLDTEGLSRLLYFTYGMSRSDLGRAVIWPYHRFVPSPRAFFPTELYCWLPASETFSAGIYYYDPAHHCLVLLREGDHRSFLGAALGADVTSSRIVLLISSLFWKNAFFYRNYTYRVAPQEVGILAGNALMVAGTFGLGGVVHHQFLDHALNALIGLTLPDESVMAVISLRPFEQNRYTRDVGTGTSSRQLAAALPPISPTYVQASALDRGACATLIKVHESTLFHDTNQFVVPAPIDAAGQPEPAGRKEPAFERTPADDLADLLVRRGSGMWVFNVSPPHIPRTQLLQTLEYALDSHDSDVVAPGAKPAVDCFVAINKVDGIDSGFYSWEPAWRLQALSRRSVASHLQEIGLGDPPQVNYGSVNFVVFLVVNRSEVLRVFGNRGFRIASAEGGIVAQRICTMAAGAGLTARVHNGYLVDRVLALFEMDPAAYSPLFQIIVGRSKPTARYQMRISV